MTATLHAIEGDHSVCLAVREYVANFSNEVRLLILCRLAKSAASVAEITEAVGRPQPTVSQQLRHLRMSGIVSCEQDGNRRVYRICDPDAKKMMRLLGKLSLRFVEGSPA